MLRHKTQDIVVGLDSSTQSAKAIAWNARGDCLAEGRADIPLSKPQASYAEQNCEDWWISAFQSLRQATQQIDSSRIAGLAISNQRETVAFLDNKGKAVRPAMVWLDERSRSELAVVDCEFGATKIHRISGKPIDITPVVYRLSWMRNNYPDLLERCAKIVDVHAFLCHKLTGRYATSWTSADPFGIFDIHTKQWSAPILKYLGLQQNQFATLFRPGSLLGHVHSEAAKKTGLAIGTAVYAAGGDGQCAGLGANTARPGQVYLNLGTALITGAWSDEPRISYHWRTMTSPDGEGYFLEGCQRAGTFLLDWFMANFCDVSSSKKNSDKQALFTQWEKQASVIDIGSEGVMVCPYLVGCMDPHWDPAARASIHGLSSNHGQVHVYRAMLEALTLESARVITKMCQGGLHPSHIIAVGGGGNSALWTRMLCDAIGLPLSISQSLEASSLGAAMCAAVGAGWFADFRDASSQMSCICEPILPNSQVKQQWDNLSEHQARTYIAS